MQQLSCWFNHSFLGPEEPAELQLGVTAPDQYPPHPMDSLLGVAVLDDALIQIGCWYLFGCWVVIRSPSNVLLLGLGHSAWLTWA